MQARQPLVESPNGAMELSNEEIARYSRRLIMPEVALDGQKQLKAAKVLTVGTGGLGSPLALYLAAAGVGTIGIVDFDVVDESNLQRQIIHGTSDVGRPKVESAYEKLKDINPNVEVRVHDSNQKSRFMVMPMRPEGTDGWTDDQLASIVTRDTMIGVALPRLPAAS